MKNEIESQILFVVGPTASGKSSLALRVADYFNGEIICADSQTVRKYMDIGTAKPTNFDRKKIKHHLLDIDPYDDFSASKFKQLAEKSILDISKKGNLPILVGGTGLYIDSLIYDFSFKGEADKKIRTFLMSKSVKELQEIIISRKLEMPENNRNPRHLIRTIETEGKKSINQEIRLGAKIVGLMPDKETLDKRIKDRALLMVKQGFIDEVENIINKFGEPPKAWDAIGYKIVLNNIRKNNYDVNKLADELYLAHRKYAKKQKTWFKRNSDIAWFENSNDAFEHIKKYYKDTL